MSGPRTKRRMLLSAAIALLFLVACPLLGGRAEAAISCTLTGPTLTFGHDQHLLELDDQRQRHPDLHDDGSAADLLRVPVG